MRVYFEIHIDFDRFKVPCDKCGTVEFLRRRRHKGVKYNLCFRCDREIDRAIKKLHGAFEWRRRKLAPIILERDHYTCVGCGSTENLTIDHILPLVWGGTNDPDNLQTLCKSCNSAKGSRQRSNPE